MNIADNITHLVGNTPLVALLRIRGDLGVNLVGKLEFFNPCSSVKDRVALAMIESAEKEGVINQHTVIIEATSGNTGVGLAFVCAQRGYKLILTMPEQMSVERRLLLSLLGADLVLTSKEKGMAGALAMAEQLSKEYPNSFMPRQFNNPANPRIHRETTAQEILRDTDGKVDVFVAGVGTGGTVTGVGEALKKYNSKIKVVAVEPERSAVLSGKEQGEHNIQGIGAGFIPEILNRDVIDEIITVGDRNAYEMVKRLAREEGILAGISSGAAVWAAVKVAQQEKNKGKLIVVILPDTGERYLSMLSE